MQEEQKDMENKIIPFYNLEKSEDTLWFRFMKNIYLEENIERICRYRLSDDKELWTKGEISKLFSGGNISTIKDSYYRLSRSFEVGKRKFEFLELFLLIRSQTDHDSSFELYYVHNYIAIKCNKSELIDFNSILIFDSYSKKYVNLKEEYEKACKNYDEWKETKEETALKIDYITKNISSVYDKQYFLFEEINNIKEEQRKIQENVKDILAKLDLLLK